MISKFLLLILIALNTIISINATYSFQPSLNVTTFMNSQFIPTLPTNQQLEYYVGYIPIGTTSTYYSPATGNNSMLFYQLVSAQGTHVSDPTGQYNNVPLIMWLQGGPGCSSQLGAVDEFGPYIVNKNQTNNSYYFTYNQYTWANNYYLLFVDNPIGVGLSVVVGNETGQVPIANSAWAAAENLYNFLFGSNGFFQAYPTLQNHDFYIMGESFGGHYVPAISSLILSKKPSWLSFKGVGIGDGWTNPYVQSQAYASYAYSAGIIDTWRMNRYKGIQGSMIESILNNNLAFFTDMFNQFTNDQGPDDILPITGEVNNLNYRQYNSTIASDTWFAYWANQSTVRTQWNIPANTTWTACNGPIYVAFQNDIATSYAPNMSLILPNTRVMIYSGQVDLCIPTNGNYYYMEGIEYEGMEKFFETQKQIWTINNLNVGVAKVTNQLTWALVNQAGHMVPHDQPASALDMVTKWIGQVQNWET